MLFMQALETAVLEISFISFRGKKYLASFVVITVSALILNMGAACRIAGRQSAMILPHRQYEM